MGIRIHKAMGYGMVHPDHAALNDRLYEQDKPGEVHNFLKAHYDALPDKRDDKITLALETAYPALDEKLKARYPKNFSDIVHYAAYPDCADGVHLIIPPHYAEIWFRRNNDLDYTEFFAAPEARERGPEDWLKILDMPLYPYHGWMHPTTGEKLRDYSSIRSRREFIEEHGQAPMPLIPLSVRLIAEHLGFGDWKQLRPMIAVWWG